MPYTSIESIHNPATGTAAPATWGDQIHTNFEFLVDPPACSVSNNTTQNIAHNTLTALTANTEAFDNDSMHSTVTNTARITATTAGRYLVGAVTNWEAEAVTGNAHLLAIRVNGSTVYNISQLPSVNHASFSTAVSGARTLVLAATDYVECLVRQESNTDKLVTLEEFFAYWQTR